MNVRDAQRVLTVWLVAGVGLIILVVYLMAMAHNPTPTGRDESRITSTTIELPRAP